MNILKTLKREEKKLAAKVDRIAHEIGKVRAAIGALNGDKRRGRKLSAAHRRAIKAGIRRAKMKAEK